MKHRKPPKLEKPRFRVGDEVYIHDQFIVKGPFKLDGIEYDSCDGYCDPHLFYVIKDPGAGHTHHSESYLFQTRAEAEASVAWWAANRERWKARGIFPCVECGDTKSNEDKALQSVILQYQWATVTTRKATWRTPRHIRLCAECALKVEIYSKWIEVYPPEARGSSMPGNSWKKH
jgi:hypothetical protein